MTTRFQNKLNEANEARQQMNEAREEAARLRIRIRDLEQVSGDYEGRIDTLNKKIADLESRVCEIQLACIIIHLCCKHFKFNSIKFACFSLYAFAHDLNYVFPRLISLIVEELYGFGEL